MTTPVKRHVVAGSEVARIPMLAGQTNHSAAHASCRSDGDTLHVVFIGDRAGVESIRRSTSLEKCASFAELDVLHVGMGDAPPGV